MPRYACRVDANHSEIVDALRATGWAVKDTSRVGEGFPDLVIEKNLLVLLAEVKVPEAAGKKGEYTKGQKKFYQEWRGPVFTLRSVDDVVELNRRVNLIISSIRGTLEKISNARF